MLPTGQILYTLADGATIDAEIYTAKGTFKKAWAPTITTAPSSVTRGDTYKISGTQFNGLTHGAAYGDDAQMNSSYALVRITNNATKHVIYARTHNPSTMGSRHGNESCVDQLRCPDRMPRPAPAVWWSSPTASLLLRST